MPEGEDNLYRILAIDYGSKRIGLALTDPLITFAYPYKTILNDAKLWSILQAIITEQEVKRILLGMPYQDNGQLSRNAGEVMKFKEELAKRFNIEIALIDERYSSEMAKVNILQSVTKKSKRREKGLVDMNAAAIILKEYIEGIKR